MLLFVFVFRKGALYWLCPFCHSCLFSLFCHRWPLQLGGCLLSGQYCWLSYHCLQSREAAQQKVHHHLWRCVCPSYPCPSYLCPYLCPSYLSSLFFYASFRVCLSKGCSLLAVPQAHPWQPCCPFDLLCFSHPSFHSCLSCPSSHSCLFSLFCHRWPLQLGGCLLS